MCTEAKWFEELLAQADRDPEANTYELLYMITDDICRAMKAQGMTRRELAERLGVKPQYVSRFLNTPMNTSLRQIVRFAQAVGLKLQYTRLEEPVKVGRIRLTMEAGPTAPDADEAEAEQSEATADQPTEATRG